MKINIESKARSVSDLFFTDHKDNRSGLLNCYGTDQKIKKIIIPTYQRKYDWEK